MLDVERHGLGEVFILGEESALNVLGTRAQGAKTVLVTVLSSDARVFRSIALLADRLP